MGKINHLEEMFAGGGKVKAKSTKRAPAPLIPFPLYLNRPFNYGSNYRRKTAQPIGGTNFKHPNRYLQNRMMINAQQEKIDKEKMDAAEAALHKKYFNFGVADRYSREQEVAFGNKLVSASKADYDYEKDTIGLTSGKFRGAKVPKKLIDDLYNAAVKNKVDPYDLLALAGQESTFGAGFDESSQDRSISKDKLVSGWNLDAPYRPLTLEKFLADKKVPGMLAVKGQMGYTYSYGEDEGEKENIAKYFEKDPNLFQQYLLAADKQKLPEDFDYFNEAAKATKNLKSYNPGDPDYANKVKKSRVLLEADPELKKYLSMKKKNPLYAIGGEVGEPPVEYRDPYYEASAKLLHYKNILNEKLKEKNPKAFGEYFQGMRSAITANGVTNPLDARRKYVQGAKYEDYLSPEEVQKTLGKDGYSRYLDSLGKVNTYNVAQGMEPLYGTVEGEKDINKLNYGRRFASLQVVPSIASTIKGADGMDRKYSRTYKYNPDSDAVDFSEEGDITARPSYLRPKPQITAKMAGGGEVWGNIAQQAPQLLDALMGMFENNPSAYSNEPIVDANAIKNMKTPYSGFAAGGEVDGSSEEMMLQLQAMAEEQGITLEELLAQLQGDDDMLVGQDEYTEDGTADDGEVPDDAEEEDDYGYKYGGIHIKKSKRGTFTAAANKKGKSVQGFAKQVLANKSNYSSAMVKKANFARNASKWKHAYGGITSSNINAEGGEAMEVPGKGVMKIHGPKHENGGVDLKVPDGTRIYSDRIKIDGKSMEERKLKRTRAAAKLERLFDADSTNNLLKNTVDRTGEVIAKEEAMDMRVMEAIKASKNRFAVGGVVGEEDPYGLPMVNPYFGLAISPADLYSITGRNTPSGYAPVTVPQMAAARTAYADANPVAKKSIMGDNLSTGDLVGMGGTLFNAIAPLINTKNAAKATPPNINRYQGFGHDALDVNQEAQDIIAGNRARGITELDTGANSQIAHNRNSAQGVNTMRALDVATSVNKDKAKAQLDTGFANQMLQVLGQRAQLENQQDSAVAQGQTRADMETKADIDNYYTNLSSNLVGVGQGAELIGRNLNQSKQNKIDVQLLSQLSQYGLTFDKDGNLISKNNG